MRIQGLTEKQWRVAGLVADGLTDKQISETLGISERGANAFVQRIAFVWQLDPAKNLRVQISRRFSRASAA